MSAALLFAWEHCSHEGIGQVGCRICDSDKGRVLERLEWALGDARAKLQELAVVAAGRVYAGHNDTCANALSPNIYECTCGHEELDQMTAKHLTVTK